MQRQRLVIALTLLNLGLLAFSLTRPDIAGARDELAILRGRGLEIVDDRGRVRASITVMPADPTFKMPDGTIGYSETVLLRLITTEGRPNLKMATTENGAGLLLGGEDATYVQLGAEAERTSVKLRNRNGREHVIKP